MCDRSNRPTRSRTARCSSRIAVYWTGISQPANSIIRAPSARVPVGERRLVERSAAVARDLAHGRRRPTAAGPAATCTDRVPRRSTARPPGRRARAPSRRSGRRRLVETDPADLVELVVVARPGRRRSAPSGSSGRSCGSASRDWTNQYSIESRGPVIRTSRPVSSATSRRAVCSRGLAGVGRALGQGPGHGRRVRAGGCRRRGGDVRLVPDDDAARGRGGGGPQACHGAVAALDDGRRRPVRPERAQCIATAGRGRPPRTMGRAGRGPRQRARSRAKGAGIGAAQDGLARRARRRTRRRARGRAGARAPGSTGARIAPPAGPRTWRRCCAPWARNGTGSVRRCKRSSSATAGRRPLPVSARHARRRGRSRARAAAT